MIFDSFGYKYECRVPGGKVALLMWGRGVKSLKGWGSLVPPYPLVQCPYMVEWSTHDPKAGFVLKRLLKNSDFPAHFYPASLPASIGQNDERLL